VEKANDKYSVLLCSFDDIIDMSKESQAGEVLIVYGRQQRRVRRKSLQPPEANGYKGGDPSAGRFLQFFFK